MREAAEPDLRAVLAAVRPRDGGGGAGSLFLVGATSHLAEGWRARVSRLELAGDTALEAAVRRAAAAADVALRWESPADVIPLPTGWAQRSRAVPAELAAAAAPFAVRHFDPYSVVLRVVTRGDEPDYLVALEYVRHGWVAPTHLETLLAEVVPRFTNATLAQDPAEFRRKFRGLRQLLARDATERRRVPA